MAGSVITISPRIHVATYERTARARTVRDGVAVFTAITADRRQRAHLGRLRDRLLPDPSLWVFSSDHPEGVTYLIAIPVGQRHAGWFGGPKGAAVDDPDDVTVEVIDDPDWWDAIRSG